MRSVRISDEVLAILSTLQVSDDRVEITGQLDRKLYTQVNKILEALGGTWNRKLQAHVFPHDVSPANKIDRAIMLGEVANPRSADQDLGHFPTPTLLAAKLVALAEVKAGMACLEPSAGSGRIVQALKDVGGIVVAVERDPIRRERLRELARPIHVPGVDDFMTYDPMRGGEDGVKRFDRVVMNPPFAKVGLGDHLDHVRHAYDLLMPGGILVSVLPSGVTFRQDRRYVEFRRWGNALGATHAELPPDSFKESGTGVNTVTIKISRGRT